MIEIALTNTIKGTKVEFVEIYKDDEFIGQLMLHDIDVMMEMVNILRSHYNFRNRNRNRLFKEQENES